MFLRPSGVLLHDGKSFVGVDCPETAGKPVQIGISVFIIDIDGVDTVMRPNLSGYRWNDFFFKEFMLRVKQFGYRTKTFRM